VTVQIINQDGGALFKVFVGRDANRERLVDQVGRFERLRATEGGSPTAAL
jgi:heme iron utilization protein